jgi:hypothetical protein
VTGIEPKAKESTLRIRLGTKGSLSTTSYKVTPTLDFSNTKFSHSLDIVNLDWWDLRLGSPFCNQYGVVLDYNTCTIHFGETTINTLLCKEEAAVCYHEKKPHLNAMTQ